MARPPRWYAFYISEFEIDCGHLVPFEKPNETAEVCAAFVFEELERWEAERQDRERRWNRLARRERVDINDLWKKNLGAKQRDEPKPSSKTKL